jgi:hypothetical protein
VMTPSDLSPTEKLRVSQFNEIVNTLFPDGKIPSVEELQERIESGTFTVRDGFIARMYKNGLPVDPILLELEDTKEFATTVSKTFSNPTKIARNVDGTSKLIRKLNSANISLDMPFSELLNQSKVSTFSGDIYTNIVRPIAEDTTRPELLSKKRIVSGTKKLISKSAIPIEVLQGIMQGINEIPDPVLRDAVVASLLGYRGTDLAGIRTSRELAERTYPARPFYDVTTGTMVSPDVSEGGGRKGKGPDRPLGPLMQQIMDRRYKDAGPTGELFPDIDTRKISDALNTYVYPKIPEEVTNVLKRKPSGYTDMRRITASAIANQLGDPSAASEIISHTGNIDTKIDKVMTGFYADVEDLESFEARRNALIGFETLMAEAVNAPDAKGLGDFLNLELPEDFNAEYPPLKIDGQPTLATTTKTATSEEIKQGKIVREASSNLQAESLRRQAAKEGLAADEYTLKRAEKAEEVAEAEATISEAKKQKVEESKISSGKSLIQQLIDMGKPTKLGIGLATAGAAALKQVPIVGGVMEAQAARLEGASMEEALLKGAGETLLPISPSDIQLGEQAFGALGSQMQEMMESPSPEYPEGQTIQQQMQGLLGTGGGFNFNF